MLFVMKTVFSLNSPACDSGSYLNVTEPGRKVLLSADDSLSPIPGYQSLYVSTIPEIFRLSQQVGSFRRYWRPQTSSFNVYLSSPTVALGDALSLYASTASALANETKLAIAIAINQSTRTALEGDARALTPLLLPLLGAIDYPWQLFLRNGTDDQILFLWRGQYWAYADAASGQLRLQPLAQGLAQGGPPTSAIFTIESACALCGLGKYSTGTGALSPAECEPCPPGEYGPLPGLAMCAQCGMGTFLTATGAVDVAACRPCIAGSYQSALGATGSEACTYCREGKFETGTGMTDAGACVPCDAGTYAEGAGLSSADECLLCPPGKYSTVLGMTLDNCWDCDPGTFQVRARTRAQFRTRAGERRGAHSGTRREARGPSRASRLGSESRARHPLRALRFATRA